LKKILFQYIIILKDYFNDFIIEEKVDYLIIYIVVYRRKKYLNRFYQTLYTLIRNLKHFKRFKKVLTQVSKLFYEFWKEHIIIIIISLNKNSHCPHTFI